MSEIIFSVVEDEVDGGYIAKALGHSIVTEAETWDELRRNVREAVLCHFDNASEVVRESPRLLVERDELRDRLLAEIQIGSEQLRRGEGVPVASDEEFQSQARTGR